jgi:hypothetical protein
LNSAIAPSYKNHFGWLTSHYSAAVFKAVAPMHLPQVNIKGSSSLIPDASNKLFSSD